MTKWYLLRGGGVRQSKQKRGVALPEARAACSALSRMLAVTAPSSLSLSLARSLAHSLSALFERMFAGQRSNPDKLAPWQTGRRSKCGAAAGKRLARSGSSRPSWMLFHPSLWLIQNQLSHPNGPIAGCKLARFRVQINQERNCVQRRLGSDQAETNEPIIEVNTKCTAIVGERIEKRLFIFLYVLILDYTVQRERCLRNLKNQYGSGKLALCFPLICLHSGSSASKDTDFGPSPETQSLHTLQLLILSTQLSFEWPCGLFYYTHQFYYLFYWLFYRKSGCKASSDFSHSFLFQ